MSLNEKKPLLFSHVVRNLFYFVFFIIIYSVIFLKKKKKHCLLSFSLFGFLFISCNSVLISILYVLWIVVNFLFTNVSYVCSVNYMLLLLWN